MNRIRLVYKGRRGAATVVLLPHKVPPIVNRLSLTTTKALKGVPGGCLAAKGSATTASETTPKATATTSCLIILLGDIGTLVDIVSAITITSETTANATTKLKISTVATKLCIASTSVASGITRLLTSSTRSEIGTKLQTAIGFILGLLSSSGIILGLLDSTYDNDSTSLLIPATAGVSAIICRLITSTLSVFATSHRIATGVTGTIGAITRLLKSTSERAFSRLITTGAIGATDASHITTILHILATL